MKKTKAQKAIIWKNRMWPFFWTVINDRKACLLVMSWLTGELRVLDK